MKSLPESDDTLFVRTDFTDQDDWLALWDAVTTPNEDDFLANLRLVDDREYQDATPEQLTALAPDWSLLVVADTTALTAPENPLLVIYARDGEVDQLRVIPEELWSIENNISLANMDWEDFADAADDDGVFRGF